MPPFSSEDSLFQKISYHIKKLEQEKGTFLYDNSFKNDINQLFQGMKDVGSLNDRVANKYTEIVISLADGETLDDDKFLRLAFDYMKEMGYEESNYNIWRHQDKPHEHIHILLTTVDFNGNWIPDHFSGQRSQKISRELEEKYGLKVVEYEKFEDESLSQVKAREYYFDNALKKGLRSYNSKTKLEDLLKKEGHLDLLKRNKFTNNEIKNILGNQLYFQIGDLLEKYHLFNKLYKDELLGILDTIYPVSTSKSDFFRRLQDVGVYVRQVSDKGKHHYVYGLADVNIYFKDSQLPLTYRYDNLLKFKHNKKDHLLESEQKNKIYVKAFLALEKSENFDEFIGKLEKLGVSLITHTNKNGIYGLSFKLIGVTEPVVFKASSVSRNLSYNSVNNYFAKKNKPLTILLKDNPVFIKEMYESEQLFNDFVPTMANKNDLPEDFLNKKRKKKKRKDNQQSL